MSVCVDMPQRYASDMRRKMTFEEELEGRVLSAFDGSPMSRGGAERIRLAARTACVNHGLHDARVVVRQQGNGYVLEVIPPPRAPRVQRIVVNVG